MKSLLSAALLMCALTLAYSQNLYLQTFGNPQDPALIFLHGGPGYNCAVFEGTTAAVLAAEGFFVVVYDRRGEGRSTDPQAQFTFAETLADLNGIYDKYQLKKAILLGHSFGGIAATRFAEAYPDQVQALVLVSAPVALQATFKHIIAKSKAIYLERDDKVNLNYMGMLEAMDTTSLWYSSYCFLHAMQNGFYSPPEPTAAAQDIYAQFRADTLLATYAQEMTYPAPQGFWTNEHYTTIDLTASLQQLHAQGMPIYGLYGQNDGLYAPRQVAGLEELIGSDHLQYFDNCSHNVFVDQQTLFLAALKSWLQ